MGLDNPRGQNWLRYSMQESGTVRLLGEISRKVVQSRTESDADMTPEKCTVTQWRDLRIS